MIWRFAGREGTAGHARQEPPVAEDSDRIDPYVWRVAVVIVLGSIMSILDTTIVNVALDTLHHNACTARSPTSSG